MWARRLIYRGGRGLKFKIVVENIALEKKKVLVVNSSKLGKDRSRNETFLRSWCFRSILGQ